MAKQRPAPPGKRRTREHVIADLAVNYLERHVLLCGYTLHRVYFDYGYDLAMTTYDENGEVEPGLAFFQVKATDRLPLLTDGRTISWPISRRDLRLWLNETFPVILVVYDGLKEKTHWLYVQRYFASRPTSELFTAGDTINVRIPSSSRINRRSVEMIAAYKRDVQRQIRQKEPRHD